jgi:peptidase U49-like protein
MSGIESLPQLVEDFDISAGVRRPVAALAAAHVGQTSEGFMVSIQRRRKRSAKRRRRREANRIRRRRVRLWPIRILLDHFFGALERVAPEKAAFLKAEMTANGVRLAVEATEEPFLFSADPPTKTITVGTGTLGRLWATAYGYYCIYTKVAATKRANLSSREIEFGHERRTAVASMLLSWSVHTEMTLADLKQAKKPLRPVLWPAGLPKPRRNVRYASDGHVADELFLCAGAYILHHELAHFRCKHERSRFPDENRDMEREADEAAAEWLLEGLDVADPRFLKRVLGIALALGWRASMALHVPEDQEHYPPSYERLTSIIGRFVPDVNHLVWAFVSTLLRANLESAGISYDKQRETTSFKDDVEYCVALFKNNQAKKVLRR